MRLTAQQSYQLLAAHGSYITEICDGCGSGIGPLRYTRRGEASAFCSRECRDGADAREPGSCRCCKARLPEGKRRGASFCDDACRKAFRRISNRKLSRTKPSIYAGFCSIPEPGRYTPSRNLRNALQEGGR